MHAGTTSFAIDVERLLAPISIAQPAGEWLRYEGTYDRIREARLEDDPDLDQGVWERELKKADWGAVQELCLEALETRSKDLQLAVWLMEAWVHLHGLAGAREGLRVIIGLCESYWEGLYPQLDGGDLERRLAPLEWMDERLALLLKHIPVAQPQVHEAAIYTWADWESACHLEKLAKKNRGLLETAAAEGKATLAKFFISVKLTPGAFYARLNKDVGETIATLASLERLLDELCGKQAPSFEQLKSTLFAIRRLVQDIMKEHPPSEEPYPPEGFSAAPMVMHDNELESEQVAYTLHIHSRAEAYRLLAAAAEYLMRTEPHSPTPYLVKRAVAWGGMTLGELLQELISDEKDLQQLYAFLGLHGGHHTDEG
jgi:type VI secretion system protein ImpA